MRTSTRPWFAALGILPVALLLSGCLGAPPLPGIPGGPGAPDLPDEELVEEIVEGSGGGIDFESGSLPPDFPVDAVPLVPGEVGPSMSISDGTAWIVTIYVDDQATADTAARLLEQAGYDNDSVFAWENEQYLVVLTGVTETDDGRFAVSYQVQEQS